MLTCSECSSRYTRRHQGYNSWSVSIERLSRGSFPPTWAVYSDTQAIGFGGLVPVTPQMARTMLWLTVIVDGAIHREALSSAYDALERSHDATLAFENAKTHKMDRIEAISPWPNARTPSGRQMR